VRVLARSLTLRPRVRLSTCSRVQDAVFSIIATVLILPLMEQLKEMSNSGETKNDYAYTLTINYLAFWVTYFMLGMLIRNHSQVHSRARDAHLQYYTRIAPDSIACCAP